MRSLLPMLAMIVSTAILAGCKSPTKAAPVSGTQGTNAVVNARNNSASLLYQLLSEEQHASKLLVIKQNRKELGELMKRISSVAGDAVKSLEEAAKKDPTLNLKVTGLPTGEQAARELQSGRITKELLSSKGEEFEFKLLMAQAQALGYATSLAEVAAANEPDATRRTQWRELSSLLSRLEKDVTRLIRAHR